MRIAALTAMAIIGLSSASAHAAVNLVADGDFSNPSGGASFVTYSSGTPMGPWSVGGDSVDLIGGYWQAPGSIAGTGSVDLDGNAPGSISQTLTLSSGNYLLSFDLSGNPDGGSSLKLLNVDLSSGGSPAITPFSYTTGTNTYADMQYVVETLPFSATGNTTLTFASADTGTSYGAVIGDVIVSAVPEPATWSMLIFGIGAIGTMLRLGRRRQNSRAIVA